MRSRERKGYRDGVPLQPPYNGILGAIQEELNVLRQQQAIHQALCHSPSLTLSSHPYTRRSWQGLATKRECGLPIRRSRRGRGHFSTALGHELGTTHRFPDHNPARRTGRCFSGRITYNSERLVLYALFLFLPTGLGRRRRITVLGMGLLRLGRRSGAGQKMVGS